MRLHTQSDASYYTRSHGGSVAGDIAYLDNSDQRPYYGLLQLRNTRIFAFSRIN